MIIDELVYNGLKFKYRHNTTDFGIIKEACGGLNTRQFDVKPGEIWFDIGAHIGAFTCYAASKGAIVSAFEPIPDNFSLLQQNVILNGLESTAKTYNLAVTDKFGKIELFVDENNYGNCSKYNRGLSKTVEVETIPASSINIFDGFCMKIDTEGCEYDVLSQIDLYKMDKLIFEWHYWLVEEPVSKLEDIYNWLNEAGIKHTMSYGGYMHYAWR